MIKDQLIFRREGEVYLRCEVTLMANPEMDILVLLCAELTAWIPASHNMFNVKYMS